MSDGNTGNYFVQAESLECVSGFLNDEDEKELCQQFSKQSSHVFSKFAAVVECTKHMDRDDVSEL